MRRLPQILLAGGVGIVVVFLAIRANLIIAFVWAGLVAIVLLFNAFFRGSITRDQAPRILSGILTYSLALVAITLWIFYWNFNQILWEPPHPAPTLEMSTIGIACAAAILTMLVEFFARRMDKHPLARYLILPDVPLLACMFLMIYLRYGVIPPLIATNIVDFVVTVIFVYVVVSSIAGFIVEQVWPIPRPKAAETEEDGERTTEIHESRRTPSGQIR
jgi:hypothetical protein